MAEEFQPFPSTRVQQIEERQKSTKAYHSPHMPQKPKASAQNMTTNMPQPAAAPINIPQTVDIQSPGFTRPVTEAEAVVLDLPSRYAFYPFKDLYVKPFKGLHLGKMSRAKEERSTLHMVEAVSAVLSNSSGDTNLGFQLTLPDFYFVLYWLRLNSFTKNVFIHESICTSEEHIQKVMDKEMERETLRQAEVIHRSRLTTNMLDSVPNPEAFVMEYPGLSLQPCTMQDAIEMTEDPEFVNEEFRFAAQVAVFLRTGQPSTVRDRVAIVNDMSPDDIKVVKLFEASVSDYGILEEIQVTCKGCGVSRMDRITLDAHSFFP